MKSITPVSVFGFVKTAVFADSFDMVQVKLAAGLKKMFPAHESDVDAANLRDLLRRLDEIQDGFSSRIVDEQGRIRPEMNVFINGRLVIDKHRLDHFFEDGSTIHFMPVP